MNIRGILLLALSVSLTACAERRQGPLERAGERIDEIVDNAEKGKPLLHKAGPAEKAGQAVDETIDDVKRSVNRRRDD